MENRTEMERWSLSCKFRTMRTSILKTGPESGRGVPSFLTEALAILCYFRSLKNDEFSKQLQILSKCLQRCAPLTSLSVILRVLLCRKVPSPLGLSAAATWEMLSQCPGRHQPWWWGHWGQSVSRCPLLEVDGAVLVPEESAATGTWHLHVPC